mmetsp:Transcript_11955/g.13166  ORF Transcript_11955/g.13166 Transcript_11955/m.13166 type:complete len:274 (-) Transcript_11955:289-1110(-)
MSLRLRSTRDGSRDWRYYYKKGCQFFNKGQYSEAQRAFSSSLKQSGDQLDTWINKAVALYFLCKFTDALKTLEKCITLFPKSGLAYFYKGCIAESLGKRDEALVSYDKGLELLPDNSSLLNNKGLLFYHNHQYEEAIACFTQAVSKDKEFRDAWNNKGCALQEIGELQEALFCFERALEIDANFTPAWMNKANMFLEAKNFDVALKCYQQCISLSPKRITLDFQLTGKELTFHLQQKLYRHFDKHSNFRRVTKQDFQFEELKVATKKRKKRPS